MRNRVVLITGASSGIGAAAALTLAETCRVVLVARRRERLEALAARITEAGGQAQVIVADLAAPGEAARVIAETVAGSGGLDAVVNNAGLFATRAAAEIDAAHLESLISINLIAPMLLTAAAIPHLSAHGGGWVVNISSVAADASFSQCGAYAASKAGLEAWSRSLREELRPLGIRVCVIAPGPTDTEVWPAAARPAAERVCRAEDVARCIALVLSTPASAAIEHLRVMPPAGLLP